MCVGGEISIISEQDPKQREVNGVIKEYKKKQGCYKPPQLPKRTDSIAKNIDKYFNTDLLKKGEEEDKQDLGMYCGGQTMVAIKEKPLF